MSCAVVSANARPVPAVAADRHRAQRARSRFCATPRSETQDSRFDGVLSSSSRLSHLTTALSR
jgi:hypothetical protein